MIIYEGAPRVPFPGKDSVKQASISDQCVDESEKKDVTLTPIVPWDVDSKPSNNVTRDSFTAALETFNMPWLVPEQPFAHWVLANDTRSNPLWVDFGRPTILDPLRDTNFSAIVRCELYHFT